MGGFVIIWGKGFDILSTAEFLPQEGKRIFYWGDLDFAGFKILGLLRRVIPDATSLLMNNEDVTSYAGEPVKDSSLRDEDDSLWFDLLTDNEKAAMQSLQGRRIEQEFLIENFYKKWEKVPQKLPQGNSAKKERKFRRGETVVHLKTQGRYLIEETPPACRIELTGEPAYAYRSQADNTLWVRCQSEMEDGRFSSLN